MDNDERIELIKDLLEIDPDEISVQAETLLIDLIKESTLIMPIEITSESFVPDEEEKDNNFVRHIDGMCFRLRTLVDDYGDRHLILFTDTEEMTDYNYSSMTMDAPIKTYVEEFKKLTSFQTIIINPFGDHPRVFSFDFFMSIFDEKEINYDDLLEKFNDAETLEENLLVYVREDSPNMYNQQVNGICINEVILDTHLFENFNEELEVVNEIFLPVGTRFLFIGTAETENPLFLLPPGTHFEFIEEESEDRYLWKCVYQEFYEEEKQESPLPENNDEKIALLKQIMMVDPENLTQLDKNLLYTLLKNTNLLLPVELTSDLDIPQDATYPVTSDKPFRFKTRTWDNHNGTRDIIFFTDIDEMKNYGYASDVCGVFIEDLIDALKTMEDVDSVFINPFSEYSLGFPYEQFIEMFEK
ncbi:SseB family protein [Methanosphaera sp.]